MLISMLCFFLKHPNHLSLFSPYLILDIVGDASIEIIWEEFDKKYNKILCLGSRPTSQTGPIFNITHN